ncbi:hypothetical protein PMSD_27930 [Paenibacillus macquariensis subsp. defensor]|nr:hypothetical protein PMSD_27930 [Paenibacillus macquariensis subsp. defensor]
MFWCISFIGLGNMFGSQWENLLHTIESYSWSIVIILVLLGAVAWLVKRMVQSSRRKTLRGDEVE